MSCRVMNPDMPKGQTGLGGVSTADATLIETKGLSKSFDGRVVVDRVDLHVRDREIFGLIGPNGAGKSTLIKMLTTLLPPTSGEGRVAGYDIVSQPAEVRRHIGY